MPNFLSVPVASLLNVLNISQPRADSQGADSSGADNFSSLLNIGNNTDDTPAPARDTAPAAPQTISNNSQPSFDAIRTPLPDAPIAPAPVRSDAAPRDTQNTAPDDARQDTQNDVRSSRPVPKAAPDAPHNDNDNQPVTKPAQSDSADKSQPAAKAAPTDTKAASDDEQPVAEDEKDTGKKIKAQLGNISQTLLSILQALGVPAPAAQVNAATQATDTAPTTTTSATAALAAQATGQVLPGAPAANPAGSTTPNAAPVTGQAAPTAVAGLVLPQDVAATSQGDSAELAALVANAQQLLALAGKTAGELKSREVTLTPVEVGTGKPLGDPITSIPVPEGSNAPIATLAATLEDSIGKLTSLLQQLQSAPASTQATTTATTADTAVQAPAALPDIAKTLPDVFAKLTASLDAVKTELALVPAPKNATTAAAPSAAATETFAALAQDAIPTTPVAVSTLPAAFVLTASTPAIKTDDAPRKNEDDASPVAAINTVPKEKPAIDLSTPAPSQPVTAESKAPAPAAPAHTQAAQQAAAQVIPVIDPKLNPAILPQAVAAPVATAQNVVNAASSSSSDFSNSSDDQQQAPAAQAPVTAAPGQAQNASQSYKSDFARNLEQAAKPVFEQVAFNIKTAASNGSSRISIQLSPGDLGKLDVKIHIGSDGKTNVVITAENKETLAMLQRDAQNLTRSLNDAGLQTDSGSLSFNLGGQQDAQQGQDFGRSQATQTYQKSQPEDENELALNTISRSYVVNLADGLDIKI